MTVLAPRGVKIYRRGYGNLYQRITRNVTLYSPVVWVWSGRTCRIELILPNTYDTYLVQYSCTSPQHEIKAFLVRSLNFMVVLIMS